MSIKIILLTNNLKLISQIEEVGTELGEPDCKLIDPWIIGEKDTLSQWLIDVSSQREIML